MDRRARAHLHWYRWSERLRCYTTQCTLSALPCFESREGWFVMFRAGVFIGLLVVALLYCPAMAGVIAFYFIADALLVNTSIVFVSGSPLSPLRSVVLTIFTYLSLALGFAVGWVWLVGDDKTRTLWDRATNAAYESLRTIATVGPEKSPVWPVGKLLVMAELLVGIYFVAIVIAIYASWARTGRSS
jgi:hypothetical protein